MKLYQTYRVWFSDGTALLVNALNTNEARQEALILAKNQGKDRVRVVKVDQLS